MAEAIISRAASTTEPLPIAPGYHTVAVLLKDYDDKPIAGYSVNCKDGSATYNYTTNEKGKCIFMVNSGSANIYINNYSKNGYRYVDFEEPGWFNVDAPVGLTQTLNIQVKGINIADMEESTNFTFLKERICDLYIVGAGGSGGTSTKNVLWAGGGGAGYMNNYYNQVLNGEFSFIRGEGGASAGYWNQAGKAGGTSYIKSTTYSAAGGGGARVWDGGIGGLGNGKGETYSAEDSPVDFAGGGGGGGYGGTGTPWGGSPYGGKQKRGGGGAGGWQWNSQPGGPGMLRIEFK